MPHSWTVVLTESCELGNGRAGGGRAVSECGVRHLDDYRCTLLCRILRGCFHETAPRKTAVKHRGGGVGSVVASHHGGDESSMVVTTLDIYSLTHIASKPTTSSSWHSVAWNFFCIAMSTPPACKQQSLQNTMYDCGNSLVDRTIELILVS